MTKSRKIRIIILSVFLILLVFVFIAAAIYIIIEARSTVEEIYIDYKYGDVRSINPYYLMMVYSIIIITSIIGIIEVILLAMFYKNKRISQKGYKFLRIDKRICMISALLSFILIFIAMVLILKAITIHLLYNQLSYADYESNNENSELIR